MSEEENIEEQSTGNNPQSTGNNDSVSEPATKIEVHHHPDIHHIQST